MNSRTKVALVAAAVATVACAERSKPVPARHSYLYVFAGADDVHSPASDFLAVIDADATSAGYGRVVATAPIRAVGTMPHHMELVAPGPGQSLFANGFMSGRVFLFDLANPLAPRLTSTLDSVPGFAKPHSFWRLGDGRVLATVQYGDGKRPGNPGGLALLSPTGKVLKTASSADSAFPGAPIRTYSLDVAPSADLVITTSTPMDNVPSADVVQLWRLSDLTLRRTFSMPNAADSTSHYPFEVRFLPGDSLAVLNTWRCGLYVLSGLRDSAPSLEPVLSLAQPSDGKCGVPAVIGHYWIIPVGKAHEYRVFDISDPRHPRPASVLRADSTYVPHWIAREPSSDRLVLTSDEDDHRVLIARFDSIAGTLRWDTTFRDPGASRMGVDFKRASWPHGANGPAMPHGAAFGTAPAR